MQGGDKTNFRGASNGPSIEIWERFFESDLIRRALK